jgi:hypothetical protein
MFKNANLVSLVAASMLMSACGDGSVAKILIL